MEVKIEKLDNYGRGIAYINNKICFIENTLPNEIVDISITEEHKKYNIGNLDSIIESSPIRIQEECPYSNICGGCSLNHICYNEENNFKKDKVKNLLKIYSNIEEDKIDKIIYHDRNYYRNKITLHGKEGTIGLYKKNTNDIIPIQECLLVNQKINELIRFLSHQENEIEEVIIKTSNDNSEIMVSIKGSISNIDELKKICDVLIINNKYLTTKKSIITTIGNKKYYESIDSFFQVNNTLTKELYNEVLNNIKDKNFNKVLDLYCGTGTIGIYISKYVKEVIGIDYNKSNIEDAKNNKVLNNIENISFICDKVENQIDKFKNIDCIIVDPPRAGLDEKTRKFIGIINPKEIIYVSCDPVTLARDLKELQEKYTVKKVVPYNMFPRTYHCESITVLERR